MNRDQMKILVYLLLSWLCLCGLMCCASAEVVNVQDHGAKPMARFDKVYDSAEGFKAASDHLLATMEYPNKAFLSKSPEGKTVSGTLVNERTIKGKLSVPAGDYLIGKPEVFIGREIKGNTRGYDISGEGMPVTRLIYRPKKSGPLFGINGSLMFGELSDISFVGDDAQSNCYESIGKGGAQGTGFDRVAWAGLWRHGVYLNNWYDSNSEHVFNDCQMKLKQGSGAFFFSEGTDQQVTYSFRDCEAWMQTPWIVMRSGGNLLVDGGSLIYTNLSGKPDYAIQLYGQYHSDGVEEIDIRKLRIEPRNRNSCFLYCNWGRGKVVIDHVWNNAMDHNGQTSEQIVFDFGSKKGPTVIIEGSTLSGSMRVKHSVPPHPDSVVILRDCTFTTEYTRDFVKFDHPERHPLLVMENCQSAKK